MSLLKIQVKRTPKAIVGCVIATLALLLVGCPDTSGDGGVNNPGGGGVTVNNPPTLSGNASEEITVMVNETQAVDLGSAI